MPSSAPAQAGEELGAVQQRLGRDAAPVGADAAEVLFSMTATLAKLRRADRRDVTAGTSTDDN